MSDDLTARLERALLRQEKNEGDLQPEPAALADLHARVGRGRRHRTFSQVAAVTAAVVVLGGAGWFVSQERQTPEPALTPTPSPSSTVTPTPTPSAGATTPPPEPVQLPGLPPMLRAPEGVLEQTGPGWFVAAYASGRYEPSAGDGQRRTLALSAPTGELYHLTDLTTHDVHPVRWHRADVVRAMVGDGQGAAAVGSVDLLTGEVTVDERLPRGITWVGTSGTSGTEELWLHATWQQGADGTPDVDGTLYVVPEEGPVREVPVPLADGSASPDGTRVAGQGVGQVPVAVDVATGRVTELQVPPGQTCTVTAWLDATGLLASCVDVQPDPPTGPWYHDEHAGRTVRLDTDGGAPQTLASVTGDGVVPHRGRHVRDGVVVTTRAPVLSTDADCYEFCYGGAYLWADGAVREVTRSAEVVDDVCEVEVASSSLLLRTGDVCYEETTGNQWWAVDEATGATRLVAPAVRSELGIGAFTVVERAP